MHWSEQVRKILESSTGDLRELAEIAGFDPRTFYRSQSLAGCDLRGQDLRGFDLEGCELEKALLDRTTKIDPEFDPRHNHDETDYLNVYVSQDLNTMVLHFMQETGYSYGAWAYKNLFERGLRQMARGRFNFYDDIIEMNPYLRPLTSAKKSSHIRVNILLRRRGILDLQDLLGAKFHQDFFRTVLLVGLICRKIPHNSKKDYSTLPPNGFYPPKLIRQDKAI